MSDSDDFTKLDDPAFLAERRRVREELEHTPQHAVSPETAARYEAMNEEFLRRARLAWTQTSQEGKRSEHGRSRHQAPARQRGPHGRRRSTPDRTGGPGR